MRVAPLTEPDINSHLYSVHEQYQLCSSIVHVPVSSVSSTRNSRSVAITQRLKLVRLVADESNDHAVKIEEEHEQVKAKFDE